MKNFKYILFAGLAMSISLAEAQVVDGSEGYYEDALTFGQMSTLSASTARMQGLAGTQTSLGADMSSAGSNPAGLGFFNRSVVSFTPSINFNNSDARYMGGTLSTYKNNFNFSNLGVVFNSNKGNYTDEKFKGGSFAITLQRANSFNNEITYQGRNQNNSIVDSFLEDAGTLSTGALSGYALSAYDNYLINPVYDDNGNLQGYDSFVLGFPQQQETISKQGSQYALNFAWGGNYDDKVYFGAGIGFVSLNYQINRNYREDQFLYEDNNGNTQIDDWINYINLKDELSIEGSGVNGNFGMIVRPVDFVTLGVSYQTPTYYNMDDRSSFTNNTDWNGVEIIDGGDTTIINNRNFVSDLVVGQYNLRTPAKLSVGGTLFLGKVGFISGDVDFVDYTTGQLKSSDFSMTADNQTINSLYTNTINYRVGGEFRMDNFRFRAGYAHTGDPYANNDAFDATRQSVSVGVGYRSRDFFIDMALVNQTSFNTNSPYTVGDNQPIVNIENKTATLSATMGFNF